MQKIRVWDIPVRLFHWLLVLSLAGLFITANLGGNWMEWHKKIGYFTLGLITFRFLWGIVGSTHAQFKNFVRGPGAVLAYAKQLVRKDGSVEAKFLGHNPMGALSVLALLASVFFQAVTGLFSNDDIMLEGPYASMVSKSVSDLMTKLHNLNSDLLIVLIVLHLAAILFYVFYKKEPLIKAMVTGDKLSNPNIDGVFEAKMAEKPRPAWLSWFFAIAVGALTYAVVTKAFV